MSHPILPFPAPAAQVVSRGTFSFNYKTGQLEPIAAAGLLPVGAVVSYHDMANPRRRFVVTGATLGDYGHGQACTCEDGHRSTVSRSAINGPGGWQDTGEVLDAAGMAAFLAAAAVERAAGEQRTQAAASARQQRRADTLAANPHLEQVKGGTHASAKLGAANLRVELKRAFPGIKFSVTSSVYSGGDSIDIRWDLGPTVAQVKAISDKYQEGSFDGMTDSYDHNHENVWPELFGGAKHVMESRGVGAAFHTVGAALCDLRGITQPADGRSFWDLPGDRGNDVVGNVNRIFAKAGFPAGAVITGLERVEDCNSGAIEDFYRITYTAPEAAAQAPQAAAAAASPDGATVTENKDKGGVEIRFAAKPAASVLAQLKTAGWRWTRFGGCWYHRASAQTLAFAHALAGTAAPEDKGADPIDMAYEDQCAAACGL